MSRLIIKTGDSNPLGWGLTGPVLIMDLPTGPLPSADPLTGGTWANRPQQGSFISVGGQFVSSVTPAPVDPQPGTYDSNLTNPQANSVIFRNPA